MLLDLAVTNMAIVGCNTGKSNVQIDFNLL